MINTFDVELFLTEKMVRFSHKIELEEDLPKVERLCKKIDVVKTLFKFYTSDLTKKESEEEVSKQAYIAFLSILKSYAKSYADFKFINTALKLNDLLFKKQYLDEVEYEKNIIYLENLMVQAFRKVI